ncbi:DUF975 family protein [Clostridioides difficile]|uniref:DUF975 family protein n=1 Tax=Clostridioides difficile TaxID=1496 RepID=UPI0002FAC14F|nr:DUF975 family protein [Clostridioides difficile]EKJ1398268.1 DUF975 family protein [Clostridioides difficile]MBY2229341.1 DUF975 family protein [Clostridioides difficile]MCI9995235.1 DUF975 family protein [Clostridioides difficile]MCR1466100.1 DUF975 family protein [Clostridioides difficile]MDI3117273.1 DUF975 family protein [Clostridioides difficile]
MVSRQELKRVSKAQLSGNWGTCAVSMAVYIALLVLISIVGLPFEPLTTIVVAVIAFCVSAGFTCMFLKITKDEKVKIGDIFVNGRIYLRSFGFYLFESIIVYIYSFIITIIGAFLSFGVLLTSGAIEYLSSDSVGIGTIISTGITLVLIILVLMLPVYILLLYVSQATFLICEDKDNMGVFKSMGASLDMMKGNVLKLFILNFSFIGWYILSIVTLGIGLLWLIPYVGVTNCNFYRQLVKENPDVEDILLDKEKSYTMY